MIWNYGKHQLSFLIWCEIYDAFNNLLLAIKFLHTVISEVSWKSVYAIGNWLKLLVCRELEIVWLMTGRMLMAKQVCLSTVLAVFMSEHWLCFIHLGCHLWLLVTWYFYHICIYYTFFTVCVLKWPTGL